MTAITLHPILDMTPVETDKGVRFRHTDDAACMWRGRKYRIPSGCLTDFASIPRWLRPIAGQVGRHAAAATFHDVAYTNELLVEVFDDNDNQMWEPANLTRREADTILLDLMAVSGSAVWRRGLIFAAVRLRGGQYWRSEPPQEFK